MQSGGYNPNSRNEEKKRQEDREFLGRLRVADLEELKVIRQNYQHPQSPPWKRIAIIRAIGRKT